MGADTDRRYVPELDGLRAVAVSAVVLFHADPSGPLRGGFLGVDIFFVLSAFLITSLLSDELRRAGSIDLGTFYLRRLLRLGPALMLMLGVYLLLAPLAWPGDPHLRDALLAALYLSDYSYAFWRAPLHLGHSWSLAVEEQFYLVWPLLLPVVIKARKPWLLLAAAYVLLGAWRQTFGSDWLDYYFRFDTRATGLIAGIILFTLLPRAQLRPWHGYAAAALLALLAASASIAAAAAYIPLAEAAAAILVGCLATGNAGLLGRLLAARPMVWMGKLSYGVYLWHYPIAVWLRDSWSFAPTAAVAFAASVAAAALSYATVEAWGRRTARRLAAARAPAPTALAMTEAGVR